MDTRARSDLTGRSIADAANSRGRTLGGAATAADARVLLDNPSVTVIPVLVDGRYVGAVDAAALGPAIADDVPLADLARPILPTAIATETAETALTRLDDHGGLRLVVLDEDGSTYRGIVCLRSDRARLCIDAECHA